MLHDRLDDVHRRIQQAAWRSGRDPSAVTLVCVTKEITVDRIQQVLALGVTDLGENRMQEAVAKKIALGSRLQAVGTDLEPPASSLQPVRWHLIGHLQRNKAKDAVALFDVIHSVDSIALLDVLERHAVKQARRLDVLIQVNVSGETTKFGCRPQDTMSLVTAARHTSQLHFKGLMTIAPYAEDAEAARPHFRRLRKLRDEVVAACQLQPGACSLSMGMSHDFEVAIEEGADIIRVGTAIFGDRGQVTTWPRICEGDDCGE